MPELPEVESVRRTLARRIVGRRVVAVRIDRPGIKTGDRAPAALLEGRVISGILRHGKQLAIVTGAAPAGSLDRAEPRMFMGGSDSTTSAKHPAPCLCIHLGMTGSLCCVDDSTARTDKTPDDHAELPRNHVHLSWQLDDGRRIEFRDPRRFGGVWTFPSVNELWETRWKSLGPDAIRITPAELFAALHATRRPIKAALLDQNLLAGLGNIYVDELLFAAGVHPLTPSHRVTIALVKQVIPRMRSLLARAIAAGGSTLRDYVDAEGRAGGFQTRHQVYGRGGQACRHCRAALKDLRLAGRMTVYCPACQGLISKPRSRRARNR
jgi:formamidopyrimidine-DNA glycosylase